MRVGDYELVREIGRGGMGSVHEATAPDGRRLAVKLIPAKENQALLRADRELRLAQTLGEADGFVPILDVGASPTGAFIVMPLVTGGTLRDRIAKGPLGAGATLELGRKLARALAAAHARGIVHRDVKPENVLFTAEGEPLVADLGLAKHFDRSAPGATDSRSLSAAGHFGGTFGYMPREQMADSKSVGPPADVFALGAVLHECLSGTPAFTGTAVLDVIDAVETDRRTPLPRGCAPRVLLDAIDRALLGPPTARFACGAAFLRALSAPPSRGRPLLAVGASLAAVAAVTVLALAFSRPDRPRPVTAPPRPPSRGSPAPPAPPAPHLDGRSASDYLADAKAAFDGKDWASSIALATSAVAIDPLAEEAWVLKGRALELTGRDRDAVAAYGEAIARRPASVPALRLRSLARIRLHDGKGALEDAEAALAVDPRDAYGHEVEAMAALELGETKLARQHTLLAIELGPKNAHAQDLLGRVEEREGDLDAAERTFTEVITKEPRYGEPFMHRALVHDRRGEFQAALADLEKAVALVPNDPILLALRGQARLDAGGDPALSLRDAETALTASPGLWRAHDVRGRALAREHAAEALREIARAIEIVPDFAAPRVHRAEIEAALGDAASARADLDLGVRLDARDGYALVARSAFRRAEHDLAGALEDATAAIARSTVRGWWERALVRHEAGDLDAAVQDLESYLTKGAAVEDVHVAEGREKLAAWRKELK